MPTSALALCVTLALVAGESEAADGVCWAVARVTQNRKKEKSYQEIRCKAHFVRYFGYSSSGRFLRLRQGLGSCGLGMWGTVLHQQNNPTNE